MSTSLKDLIKYSPESAVVAAQSQIKLIQTVLISGTSESNLSEEIEMLKWVSKAASCDGGETFLANDVLPLLEMTLEVIKSKTQNLQTS